MVAPFGGAVCDPGKKAHRSLKRWLLLGGGRWGRVSLRVLRSVIESDQYVDVLTPSNHHNMRAWIQAERIPNVEVLAEPPNLERYKAALIINRAREHAPSALRTVSAKLPTLVEKPAALSAQQAIELVGVAKSSSCFLYPALVFCFARYLKNFAATLKARPERIQLIWQDPAGEQRWGEAKRSDSSISVVDDVMPHAYSVVSHLYRGPWLFQSSRVQRGGQEVTCQFQLGACKFILNTARNAPARRRHLSVLTADGEQALDFSKEPGFFTLAGETHNADPEWSLRKSPLTLMMQDFCGRATSPQSEAYPTEALIPIIASLGEQATRSAHQSLLEWLETPGPENHDREYAVEELRAYGYL